MKCKSLYSKIKNLEKINEISPLKWRKNWFPNSKRVIWESNIYQYLNTELFSQFFIFFNNGFWFYSMMGGRSTWQWVVLDSSQFFWPFGTSEIPGSVSEVFADNQSENEIWDRLTLVTQPMLQRPPNRTELRSMDSYIQILCRFQKCKRKVPPPSLLSNEKSPLTPPKG